MLAAASDLPPALESDVGVVGGGPVGMTLALELARGGVRVSMLEAGETLDVGGEVDGEPYPALAETRRSGVGGTSVLWNAELARAQMGARLVPLEESDFAARDGVPLSGWPFPRAELDPYLARACERLGLGAYAHEPERWSGSPVPVLGEGVETSMFRFAPAAQVLERMRAELEQADGVTCYVGLRVLRIEHRDGRAVAAVVASAPGHEVRVTARAFVLAAGGIENPRLL